VTQNNDQSCQCEFLSELFRLGDTGGTGFVTCFLVVVGIGVVVVVVDLYVVTDVVYSEVVVVVAIVADTEVKLGVVESGVVIMAVEVVVNVVEAVVVVVA
jgi:hypothetical protein